MCSAECFAPFFQNIARSNTEPQLSQTQTLYLNKNGTTNNNGHYRMKLKMKIASQNMS